MMSFMPQDLKSESLSKSPLWMTISRYKACPDCQSPVYLRVARPEGEGQDTVRLKTLLCNNKLCSWNELLP